MTRDWADHAAHYGPVPVYAGETVGDMIQWAIPYPPFWGFTNVVYSWTAKGPDGIMILGPEGTNMYWEISNGMEANDPSGAKWLKWKPGQYKIECAARIPGVAGYLHAKFYQTVGWRTEEMLVIGQVVPTTTYDSESPQCPPANPVTMVLFRSAVTHDSLASEIINPLTQFATLLTYTPYPITAKLAEMDMGYWGVLGPHEWTPQGPLVCSNPDCSGAVTPGQRLWVIQHMLNVSPDSPQVPQLIQYSQFNNTVTARQYRVCHDFQARFLTDAYGKIQRSSLVSITNMAEKGTTKLNLGWEAGELFSGSPEMKLTGMALEPESNPFNGVVGTNQDGLAFSSYATARVAYDGRNANWRLIGKDAPWIYSEIIFEIKADRTVRTKIRTSVDRSWIRDGSESGGCTFNNLNFYRRDKNIRTSDDTFIRLHQLQMQGQIECFVDSATGVWPEPAIPPSIP